MGSIKSRVTFLMVPHKDAFAQMFFSILDTNLILLLFKTIKVYIQIWNDIMKKILKIMHPKKGGNKCSIKIFN